VPRFWRFQQDAGSSIAWQAIAQRSAERGVRIAHRQDKPCALAQCRADCYKLLIIDELGFVPLGKTGAELLFELISQRYERGATFPLGDCCTITCGQRITSNLPFDEWTETFGSERLTGALLDRVTHHVNILEMNGESYRLGQSKARQANTKT